jgi:predicted phage terminase large subunit-like protein
LIKGDKDSSSDLSKEDLWRWYGKVLNTRLIKGGRVSAPRGRMLLIMTRWSVDDIAARILEAESSGWEVLKLPAIAEEDDPLGREPGEALWPEVYPLSVLADIRKPMTDQDWSGLYQQSPVADGGNLFKSANFPTPLLTCDQTSGTVVRAWDLAATARAGSDWSVGTKLLRTPEGKFVVLDVKRVRCEPQDLETVIVETAQRDGYRVAIGLPQDPGAGGKIALSYIVSKLAGYRIETSPESGDKITRAGPVISQANQGNVQILAGEWNAEWLKEIGQFPNGKFDDQVDSLSRAFGMLIKPPRITRRSRINFMGR